MIQFKLKKLLFPINWFGNYYFTTLETELFILSLNFLSITSNISVLFSLKKEIKKYYVLRIKTDRWVCKYPNRTSSPATRYLLSTFSSIRITSEFIYYIWLIHYQRFLAIIIGGGPTSENKINFLYMARKRQVQIKNLRGYIVIRKGTTTSIVILKE